MKLLLAEKKARFALQVDDCGHEKSNERVVREGKGKKFTSGQSKVTYFQSICAFDDQN